MAKKIIRLINDVAKVINNDSRIRDLIKVVFIPNYSVSLAQIIIPAADLHEQISLAGTEASGTSNMKFALNGAICMGTLDGANVEILEKVGADNCYIFGNTVEQVEELRRNGYDPLSYIERDSDLRRVVNQIQPSTFSPEEPTATTTCCNHTATSINYGGFPQLHRHAIQSGRTLPQRIRMAQISLDQHRQHGLLLIRPLHRRLLPRYLVYQTIE